MLSGGSRVDRSILLLHKISKSSSSNALERAQVLNKSRNREDQVDSRWRGLKCTTFLSLFAFSFCLLPFHLSISQPALVFKHARQQNAHHWHATFFRRRRPVFTYHAAQPRVDTIAISDLHGGARNVSNA